MCLFEKKNPGLSDSGGRRPKEAGMQRWSGFEDRVNLYLTFIILRIRIEASTSYFTLFITTS